MNLTWENVISANKIYGFSAGANVRQINQWVKDYTTFEYFCFNGMVYKAQSGHADFTGYVLDFDTRTFVKKDI